MARNIVKYMENSTKLRKFSKHFYSKAME
uniref:Uncharacterized protein n=1 Tax=Arundo donax TaxID=35708 RepID=A0A0A8Y6I3_ARUDO